MSPQGFEYRSGLTLLGLPLLHVAYGTDPITGTRRVARGIIAVGQAAFGVVAIGQLAVGVVAVGQLSVGLLLGIGQLAGGIAALGQFAAGVAAAVGQFASALYAAGQVSVCAAGPEAAVAWSCLGEAPAPAGVARGLAYVPIVLVWGVVAAALAAAVVHGGVRARRARMIPRGPATGLRAMAAGLVKLRARIAPSEGIVFRGVAGGTTRTGGAADFMVTEGDVAARVRAPDVEYYVATAGDEARLAAGDEVIVVGVAERHADAGGEPGHYREAPTRWTIGGEVAIIAGQGEAAVRASARVYPLLARMFAVAAVGMAGWAMVAALVR